MGIERWDKRLSVFLDMVESDRIRINKRYQRSGKVWPANARSFLVETVIQGLVLPPFMVYGVRGQRGRRAHFEIVDGQQRTAALRSFRQGEFRLSDAVDRKALRRKTYSGLSPADRNKFDRYELKINCIEQATQGDVREIFRRINYYTAPLNPEEQRHALFQGEFKWFVQRQRELFAPILKSSGVLKDKQIERMADAKLVTEIVHAMLNGITTTNARVLKGIYASHDGEFDLATSFGKRLAQARKCLGAYGHLPKRIARPYHAYSLLLALLHAFRGIKPLARSIPRRGSLQDRNTILSNLNTLASVLDHESEEDVSPKYRAFYVASQKGTNVASRRLTRCRWYYRALTQGRL